MSTMAFDLARYQSSFAAALFGASAADDPFVAALASQPAFAIYRNGVMKSASDALRASYPAVARLVGEDWFKAAACEFVRRSPPATPMLVDYGAGFAAFLADFEPAANLPYLADVARIDRLWTEAHVAPDAPVLDASLLGAMRHDTLADTVLPLHPAARWAWCDAFPAFALWSRNRTDGGFDADIAWQGEGILLTRPDSAVGWVEIDHAACLFLDACAAGQPIAGAIEAAVDTDPQCDLRTLMQTLVAAGAFSRLHIDTNSTGAPS